jgi:hypothetical protein
MRIIYGLLSGGTYIAKIRDSLVFLRKADNQRAVEAIRESHDYMYVAGMNKYIIERLKANLVSAHKIVELL